MSSMIDSVPTAAHPTDADVTLYREVMRRAILVANAAAEGNLEERIPFDDLEGECMTLAVAINRMLDITDAFVRESRAALSHASQGHFWRRVILRGLPGSFRSAATQINSMDEKPACEERLFIGRSCARTRESGATRSGRKSMRAMPRSRGRVRCPGGRPAART